MSSAQPTTRFVESELYKSVQTRHAHSYARRRHIWTDENDLWWPGCSRDPRRLATGYCLHAELRLTPSCSRRKQLASHSRWQVIGFGTFDLAKVTRSSPSFGLGISGRWRAMQVGWICLRRTWPTHQEIMDACSSAAQPVSSRARRWEDPIILWPHTHKAVRWISPSYIPHFQIQKLAGFANSAFGSNRDYKEAAYLYVPWAGRICVWYFAWNDRLVWYLVSAVWSHTLQPTFERVLLRGLLRAVTGRHSGKWYLLCATILKGPVAHVCIWIQIQRFSLVFFVKVVITSTKSSSRHSTRAVHYFRAHNRITYLQTTLDTRRQTIVSLSLCNDHTF
jgi:hypothetical protein